MHIALRSDGASTALGTVIDVGDNVLEDRLKNWTWPLALAIVLASGTSTQIASAATYRVPAQAPTIAAALALAAHGDSVVIAPGIYHEHDLRIPSGVAVVGGQRAGQDRGDDVVIDALGMGRIFYLNEADASTAISGLSLTNGHAGGNDSFTGSGGAIMICHSSPRINDCKFIGNSASHHGGALRITYGSPGITRCFFAENSAVKGGGAIDGSCLAEPDIVDSRFENNQSDWGGAIALRVGSAGVIRNCQLINNSTANDTGYGGGIFCDIESNPQIRFTTFVNNWARYGGAVASFADAEPVMGNCTIVANEGSMEGAGLFCFDSSPRVSTTLVAFQSGSALAGDEDSDPYLSCCDLYGNSGGDWSGIIADQFNQRGNLTADPLFCGDPGQGGESLHINMNSPCAPVSGGCGLIGAWNVGCDVASEVADAELPSVLQVEPNYPNPFNPMTTIRFALPATARTVVTIMDVAGRRVRTLLNEDLPAAVHEVAWNGQDDGGHEVAAGVYLYQVAAAGQMQGGRMALVK